ncbi:MAG: aldehyde dehydrogenase family protein [Actinobacteria bacterium]|nr:aldehyde dehydrogenase family protein [Actinomycetota bacterium]MBW3650153.1 aldehyde dehydrogenase family protein [Actinomycetota bacterium]
MIDRNRIYVAGAWVPSTGSGTLDVVDAATEEVMGRVPEGTPDDANKAVAAAKAAFPEWSRTPVEERAKYLQRITEGLQARMPEVAEVIAREVGMPINLSSLIQVGLPIMTFASLPQVLDSIEFEERIGNSLVVKEPVGVIGCITPWNYPLHQVSLKVAPALAAGNTVVLKPSEVAPLSAFILAEVIDEVGLPAGTFNLVTGLGTVVGEALVAHPDVDMISFTGSTRAGRRVAELASATVKRVSLELGGKSPNVILPDADLPKAVRAGVSAAFLNSGQTCIALSRMIVPRSRLAEVEQLVVQATEEYAPGNPLEATTRLGPVASAEQRQRVRSFIESGMQEGAKLLTGGPEAPEGLDRGYFVRPTVFSEVRNDMTIAQEEIFGPVLSIIPYDDEDEAVRIANDTIYGLAAGVWSGDTDKAVEVARRLRAGMVDVNGGNFNLLAPFGGYKQSGSGREGGKYGLEEFLEVKSMQL